MKRLVSLILSGVLIISICGCGGSGDQPEGSSTAGTTAVPATESTAPKEPQTLLSTELPEDFNSALVTFLEANGLKDTSYIISPTSFRAAMALAVSGAEGSTRDELLKAMGFESTDQMLAWYDRLSGSIDMFNRWYENARIEHEAITGSAEGAPDGAFELENSIWRNTKAPGLLSEEYMRYILEHFGAASDNVSPEEITGRVNGWVNEKTHGLIPTISPDLSLIDLVLVNALYLRTSWVNSFSAYATAEGDFKTFDGRTVSKDFMKIRESFMYYEEDGGKFVVLPMNGSVNAVFVLGDVDDVIGKLRSAEYGEVIVTLPKFEAETSLDNGQLIDFCRARGAETAFDGVMADFSGMSSEMDLFISDIIQKAKIKTDEDGIEAAAVTAIALDAEAIMEPEDPKEFTADEPFSFMLLTSGAQPEMLFYGQIVE